MTNTALGLDDRYKYTRGSERKTQSHGTHRQMIAQSYTVRCEIVMFRLHAQAACIAGVLQFLWFTTYRVVQKLRIKMPPSVRLCPY
jgi:hypothetical protein